MLWTVLGALAAGYVGLALLAWAFQKRLVYFPTRELVATPAAVGLPYEAVEFVAADGVRLSGWFVPAAEPRAVVLFCHGNAGNISHRLDTMQLHRELGLSSLHFDYRGYGESQGTPSERGTRLDAEAAWRYLTEERGIAPERILVHGRSLGGAVAARLAAERRPRGLILESTFTSVPDLGQRLYSFLPVRLLARIRHDAEAAVRGMRCPVLVVHSRDDELVPFEHGQRLFAAAPGPREFLELRGGHNEGWMESGATYRAGLERFVAAALARPEGEGEGDEP